MALANRVAAEVAKVDIRLKPKQYTREILRIICNNLGHHFGSVILVDENGKGTLFSSYNLPENYPYLVHEVKAPVLSSPSGTAVESRKIVVVNDIMAEPRLVPWYELLIKLDIKTIIWVPLFSKGKAFGTYNLYDNRQRGVSREELAILNQLSGLFSVAIISNEYIDETQQKARELENEIAERKQVEKQLRLAKEAAEAANQVKSDFLTAMSHELRTPMNAIIGFTEIMLQEEEEPERRDSLKLVHESGETLLYLIESILEFTEIESGRVEFRKKQFSMEKLLDNIYDTFVEKAGRKELLFNIKKDLAFPSRILGDVQRVEQVVSKIVDNAIKFTKKGEVWVECSYDHKSDLVVIRVSDTGVGIPREKWGTIFSLFTQVDMSATREHGGIGLGLTVAAKLIEQMGGDISFETTPGVGSTFTIQLPMPKEKK